MNRLHRPTRTALAASTLAVLALGLTACGGDDDGQAAPAPATVTVTEEAGTSTSDAGSGDTGNDDGDSTGNGNNNGNRGGNGNAGQASGDALSAAARTALDAAGGTLVSLDLQVDGTWEADVVAEDGSETRVDVSADGSEALGQRPDTDDAEDRAENQQLLSAGVDWRAALATATGELSEAPTELDLSEDDGRLLWEVGTDDRTSVLIDAGSGDVVGTDTDD